jgi:acyl-coenzyme A thioesterase PaaI-like protein
MVHSDRLPEGIENIVVKSPKGKEVRETRFITKVAAYDARYPRNMLAGSDMMRFVADMATDLSLRRDGDSSMLANMNINFHESVFGGETLEIVSWLIKEGKRSRLYGIAMYKVVSYHAPHWDRKKDTAESYHVLDEPLLCISGTLTSVLKFIH